MVKLILRLQIQQQRRVAVLLEDRRRTERSLQTMRAAIFDDPSKRP